MKKSCKIHGKISGGKSVGMSGGKSGLRFFRSVFLLFAVCFGAGISCSSPEGKWKSAQVFSIPDTPPIMPAYGDSLVLPANIAALNFCFVRDSLPFRRGEVVIRAFDSLRQEKQVFRFKIRRRGGTDIPLGKWRRLLRDASGGYLQVDVYELIRGRKWKQYTPLHWFVSKDAIDRYLLFRASQYEEGEHGHLYVSQRDLESYASVFLSDNRLMDRNCMNCHDCWDNRASDMVVHLREQHKGTLLMRGDSILKIALPDNYNLRLTYPAWHPSGKIVAFSTNLPNSVHYAGATQKIIYTLDTLSSMVFLDLEKMELFSSPDLIRSEYDYVFPAWSPDGSTLYFCRSPRKEYDEFPFPQYIDSTLSMRQNRVEQVWDDLMQIRFDLSSRTFSEMRCTYPFSEMRKSATMPKVSRDGKYLLVSLLKATTFPLQNLGDFYLMRIGDTIRPEPVTALNTPGSEKGHSFSSSGKWMVFSSSRRTMAIPETYITRFDSETGTFSKPFLVPQSRGDFYYTNLQGFVFPVLSTVPAVHRAHDVARAARRPAMVVGIDSSLSRFRLKDGETADLRGGH